MQIEDLVRDEKRLALQSLQTLEPAAMRTYKRKGFSDARIAAILGAKEADVRAYRKTHGIKAIYKRVDTCAAEFASSTTYLYSSYDEECEAAPSDREKVIVIGGGPKPYWSGGSSLTTVVCMLHLHCDAGYETIMINCNPRPSRRITIPLIACI